MTVLLIVGGVWSVGLLYMGALWARSCQADCPECHAEACEVIDLEAYRATR